MQNWAKCRGGNQDRHILKAWDSLHKKIYKKYATAGQAVLMNARPMLVGTDSWNTYPDITYNNRDLWDIWTEMLKASHINNTGYRFDVINVGRQVLGNLFSSFRDFHSCIQKKT